MVWKLNYSSSLLLFTSAPAVLLLQQSFWRSENITEKKVALLLSDTATVQIRSKRSSRLPVTQSPTLHSYKPEPVKGERQPSTSSEFLLVHSNMSESEGLDQLSGGGEDDAAVSSLRRRRRLSSAALGSPSSTTAPSSTVSRISAPEGEVESAGWEETVAPSCSAGKQTRNRVQGFWFNRFGCHDLTCLFTYSWESCSPGCECLCYCLLQEMRQCSSSH